MARSSDGERLIHRDPTLTLSLPERLRRNIFLSLRATKGACLHAEVQRFPHAGVAISRLLVALCFGRLTPSQGQMRRSLAIHPGLVEGGSEMEGAENNL